MKKKPLEALEKLEKISGSSKTVLLLLGIAIALSLFSHWMVWSEWYYPTYGNTNIHVAFAQNILQHGTYPLEDFSYGGGIPALYVPGYRVLLAGTAFIAGNIDLAQRLLVMLFAVLLPLGFFLLGRELFGDYAGIAAAFLASLPTELIVYTVRPLPQALGLALLPFAFYAIAVNKRNAAFALTAAIALVHQEAIAFLVSAAFAYATISFAHDVAKTRKISMPKESAWTALLCWALGVAVYFAWHFIATGNPNVFGLAQFSNHEGAVVELGYFIEKTGVVTAGLSALGALFLILAIATDKSKRNLSRQLFIAAMALTGLLFTKNELFGIRVFMDRFLVFWQIPLVLLAAFAMVKTADYALHFDWKISFPKLSR
ncbi:TPA: hypothetical protein HA244_00255 [Candidatus Micrarchaeota archaeon]|nr:hypothetical protein [Candidatus Micrarchaeota archaeon]